MKPLYPDTPLVIAGKAHSLIVVPASSSLRTAGEHLAREIEIKAGARPEVVADTDLVSRLWEVDFAKVGGRHRLALGNVNSNRLLAVSWGEGYTSEDDEFPGPGGHVVRTVHDPSARGIKVVVLAGSDPEAPFRAAAALLTRHLQAGAGSLVVPAPIVEVAPGPRARRQGSESRPASRAEFAASLDRRVGGAGVTRTRRGRGAEAHPRQRDERPDGSRPRLVPDRRPRLSVRFVAARDDLEILKSGISHLDPDARCPTG